MGILKCPECGATMQDVYGSKYETYYECIECGYGELREKSEYDSNDYIDEDFIDNYDGYGREDDDSYDNIENDGFDY